jgi:hypothetical protein
LHSTRHKRQLGWHSVTLLLTHTHLQERSEPQRHWIVAICKLHALYCRATCCVSP